MLNRKEVHNSETLNIQIDSHKSKSGFYYTYYENKVLKSKEFYKDDLIEEPQVDADDLYIESIRRDHVQAPQ